MPAQQFKYFERGADRTEIVWRECELDLCRAAISSSQQLNGIVGALATNKVWEDRRAERPQMLGTRALRANASPRYATTPADMQSPITTATVGGLQPPPRRLHRFLLRDRYRRGCQFGRERVLLHDALRLVAQQEQWLQFQRYPELPAL